MDKYDVHMKIHVIWLNGNSSWVRLKDFQMEHPEMVANFNREHDIKIGRELKWTVLYNKIRVEEQYESNHELEEF